MSLYDALLKTMPSAAFKLNVAGTGYDDITGNGKTLTGSFSFVAPIVNGNLKSLSVKTASMVSTTTPIFLRGHEQVSFTLEGWALPTTFGANVSILSHTGIYDGLYFDGNFINFKINFSTLGSVVASWPVPDFPEAYHVVGVYSPQKIQLYINRTLVSEVEITPEQLADGFAAEPSAVLYSGQSVSGSERLIVDGIAIFSRTLSKVEIASHFLAGRDVTTAEQNVSVNGGAYFNGTLRDVLLQTTFPSRDDWATGLSLNVSGTSGILVPVYDQSTGLSMAGVWKGSMPISITGSTSVAGIRASWDGDGSFVVAASLDDTTYTTLTNGQLIPGTTGLDSTGKVLDIRITFTGGLASDPACVRDISLTAYVTNIVYGSERSRNILLTGAASTALESSEPLERNTGAGFTFSGGVGVLTADLNTGATRTNLCTNPSLGVNATGWSGGGTRVAQGTGWAYQINGYTTPWMGSAHGVCTAGQFLSGSVVVSGPVGRTVTVSMHDGATYTTPAITITLTGSPQTVTLTSVNAATGTSPVIYVSPDATGGAWTTGQMLTATDALFELVSGVGIPGDTYYFDGDNDGIWTGTPNASTSIDVQYNVRSVAAIEVWITPSIDLAHWHMVIEARTAYAGYFGIAITSGLYSWGGASAVYINGVLTTSDTLLAVAGTPVHIIWVPTTAIGSTIDLGNSRAYSGNDYYGQLEMVATYATAPTADQALALYKSYMQNPTARVVDSVGFAIAELSNSYTNHSFDWQAISASV